jgi:hypothetical protein
MLRSFCIISSNTQTKYWLFNTFLTLTYTVNINRYSSFLFGNESVNDQAMMFAEYFLSIVGNE